jgi:nitrogen fixation/metabolism regulation signal transduction histidine kinase
MSALMFVNTAHDLPMLMAILVFAAVIAGYTAVRLSSGISGSVSVLADRARRLSEGDLSVRMALSQGDPDIAEMAMAFNEMAANLEEAAAKKRDRKSVV